MSSQSGRRTLVLGGIRSGKSELAEALVTEIGSVRYIATAPAAGDDAAWAARIAAHAERRPPHWATEEVGSDPGRLATLLGEAKPDEAVLVDDLGGWLTARLDAEGWSGAAASAPVEALAAAVRDCPAALLVLVSPEVGLSVVPATESGRLFTDGLGALNQSVAAECDTVVLVVAGQPNWLKGTDPRGATDVAFTTTSPLAGRVAVGPADAVPAAVAAAPGPAAVAAAPPAEDRRAARITVGMDLPLPDEAAADAARERLAGLDFPGAGLGGLAPVVAFAAGTQATSVPRAWQSVRVFVLHADHEGGVAAGDPPAESARRLAQVHDGTGPLALLSGIEGVAVQTVRCAGPAAAIETVDAIDEIAVEAGLDYGRQLAESAVDEGADLLVLGSCGSGAQAVAVAVMTLATSAEAAGLLARVTAPGGRIDDAAWMARCAAIRDALHRVRTGPRDPHRLLAALGGPDLAVATGVIVGAASRRTPVMLDGPVGLAAALLARDIGAQTRHWLMLADAGGDPAVTFAAEVLGVTPVLNLRLGLGEGAGALAALPLLRAALALAATIPTSPGA